MKNILIGKVIENEKNEKITYNLNFYNGNIKKSFDSKSDLLDFISTEIKTLFKLNQNTVASMKYVNVKKFDHFFVFKKINDEILVGEQSKFEYQEVQSYFGKRIKNKRLINERHFDFMDIVRAASNFKTISMWIKLVVIFISLVISIVVWINILDILNDPTRQYSQINIISYQYISLTNAIISLIVFLTSTISIYFSMKLVISEKMNDAVNDFRKIAKIRQKFRIANLLLQIVSIGLLIKLIMDTYESGNFDDYNTVSVLISVNMIFFFLAIFAQVSIIFIIVFNRHKLFKKYFPDLKYSTFLNWYTKNSDQDRFGSIDIFLLNNDESLKFYDMEIESLKKAKVKDTLQEMKRISKSLKSKKRIAIKTRIKQLKEAEV